ncbi:hypothetical protein LZL87_009804 [Fusarium oxysporum]|nr:hypothetical protein LZL87_009804 [Fusarium oxysporum]
MQVYENPSKSLTGSTPDGLTYTTYKSPTLAQPSIPIPSQTAPVAAPQDPVPMTPPQAPFIHPNAGTGLDQVQMAFWNGRDLDNLLKGEYMSAKPIFMECLDGLEVVLAPTHATFLNVLQQYVSFAVSHKDFDEATARVHKSYNDHQERLAIISISIKHDDFAEAERELLKLIAQAESLGEAYQDDALRHKHDLVHLYHDNWSRSKHTYGHTPPNRNQVEKLLLEIIHFKIMSREVTYMQTCSWDKLRDFYETTGQRDKLAMLREAQSIGKDILPENHTFHSVVGQSISDRKVSGGCCPECHVNPPRKSRKLKSEVHEFIGSESDVDYPMQSELLNADDDHDEQDDETAEK